MPSDLPSPFTSLLCLHKKIPLLFPVLLLVEILFFFLFFLTLDNFQSYSLYYSFVLFLVFFCELSGHLTFLCFNLILMVVYLPYLTWKLPVHRT